MGRRAGTTGRGSVGSRLGRSQSTHERPIRPRAEDEPNVYSGKHPLDRRCREMEFAHVVHDKQRCWNRKEEIAEPVAEYERPKDRVLQHESRTGRDLPRTLRCAAAG